MLRLSKIELLLIILQDKKSVMQKNITVFILMSLSLIGFSQKINTLESEVAFTIGNMFGSVEGKIDGMKGTIKFDPSNLSLSSFNVCIDPISIDTENEKRDNHLKSQDFFHVKKYTTICFVSKSIIRKGKTYQTTGELTLHGVTNTITIPFEVSKSNDKITFTGDLEINRFDYELEYGNSFMVGKTVDVKIVAVVE